MSTPVPQDNVVLKFLRERWLSLAVVLVTAIFVAQNRDRVSIDLFWMSLRAPLWLVLVVLFGLGLVAGLFAARQRRNR